jgi:hypothetical protein
VFLYCLDTLLVIPVLGCLVKYLFALPLAVISSLLAADTEVYLSLIGVVFEVGGPPVPFKPPLSA